MLGIYLAILGGIVGYGFDRVCNVMLGVSVLLSYRDLCIVVFRVVRVWLWE